MSTQIEIDYALLAANSYAVKENVTNPINAIPLPEGWSILMDRQNDFSGFTARAYTNGSEICIAYTGTTFEGGTAAKTRDWLMGNLTAGSGSVLAPQVTDAAKFYLDILKDNPGANITFTGHSLGGGLASLMSVYFDEPATVFDEAPFAKSADSALIVNGLKAALVAGGYTLPDAFTGYIALDPLFGAIIPSPSRLARESNISAIYVKDEILSLAQTATGRIVLPLLFAWNPALFALSLNVANISGNEQMIDSQATSGNDWGKSYTNGDPVDLHYMPLLNAFLMSNQFLDACRNNPEILQEIFTSQWNVNPSNTNGVINFLNLMVQRQQMQGEDPLGAFALDIGRLNGELATGIMKSVLIELGIDLEYAQGMEHTTGLAAGAFEPVFKPLTGGIQIEHKPEDDQWVSKGFAQLDRELRNAYPDLFSINVDRYSLATEGDLVVTAPNDNKNDLMLGGAGADTLTGGDGSDLLVGGAGNDVLDGGSGSDTYIIGGSDTIRDSDGLGLIKDSAGNIISGAIKHNADDSYTFTTNPSISVARDANLTLTLADGTVAVIENFKSGDLCLQISEIVQPVALIFGEDDALYDGADSLGSDTACEMYGGVGNDQLWGSAEADLLYGDTGHDAMQGRDGNDELHGGLGNDLVNGGMGDDLLYGEEGHDLMVGNSGNDVLYGAEGNDYLFAGANFGTARYIQRTDDTTYPGLSAMNSPAFEGFVRMADGQAVPELNGVYFVGEVGSYNVLDGGDGDDWLWGDGGVDTQLGGSGIDQLLGFSGDDVLYGGDDNDMLWGDVSKGEMPITNAFGETAEVYALPEFHGADFLDGGTGDDQLVGDGGNDTLLGGDGNDFLFGDSSKLEMSWHGDDYLDGGTGDDQLVGGGGDDTLTGGDGVDVCWGGDGVDFLMGDAGDDILHGDNGDGTGTQGDDYLDGGDGNDTLWGEGGDDTLFGGVGDDRLYGDVGTNYLDGEDGNDFLNSGGTANSLFGGAGDDTLEAGGGNNYLDGEDGADTLTAVDGNNTLLGGAGDDNLQAAGGGNYLDGEEGNNTLLATGGDNSLFAGAGDDSMQAGGGNNYLDGGDGANSLVADGGGNTLFGGSGDDTLSSGGGNSYLDGGEGNNWMVADGGSNTLISGAGNDLLSSTGGNSYLDGGEGANTLIATEGGNTLIGGSGDDSLAGGGGDNYLDGGAGDDVLKVNGNNNILICGAGDDWLFGGIGDDVFVYNIGDGVDHVVDGNAGGEINTLRFGDGISVNNITLSLGSLMLDLGNGDAIHIDNFDPNNAAFSSSIQRFEFADGTSYYAPELINLLGFHLNGTVGDDAISGTDTADTFNGGLGNDTLGGGAGNDVYVYNLGDGADVIQDQRTHWVSSSWLPKYDTNVLRFGAGITQDMLVPGYDTTTRALTLDLGNGDRIEIGTVDNPAIQQMQFADGSVLGLSEYFAQHPFAIDGTSVAETIHGTYFNDVINGMAGDDILFGGNGSDTFLYNLGDGADVVVDNGLSGDTNILKFGDGITPDMVKVRQDGPYTFLDLGNGDSIKVSSEAFTDQFLHDPSHSSDPFKYFSVQTIQFADGTSIGIRDFVMQQGVASEGTAGDDVLNAENMFYGDTASWNHIAIPDRLIGGAGNDILIGGAGGDVYEFNRGDGADTIVDTNQGMTWNESWQAWVSNDANTLSFGAGISANDITVRYQHGATYAQNSVVLDLGGGDSINIGSSPYFTAVQTLKFADGSTISTSDFFRQHGLVQMGTDGADYLAGADFPNHIKGGAGDDRLIGGYWGDVLAGGTGNDQLHGMSGSDTYVYNLGDGADVIQDTGVLNSADSSGNPIQLWQPNTLKLGAGISVDMINPIWDGVALTLNFGGGDSVAIGALNDIAVQDIVFNDGSSITVAELLVQRGIVAQDGSEYSDTMATFGNGLPSQGGAGDDVLYGSAANDTLDGGSGNDALTADAGDDVLIGGAGDDTLAGGVGNDVYRFEIGDGADTIVDSAMVPYQYWRTDTNTLRLGVGITANMIRPAYDSATGTVTLMVGFNGDRINIGSKDDLAVQNVRFADGMTLTVDQLVAMNGGFSQIGTAENDMLYGTSMADSLLGLAGDDVLVGDAGGDTLIGGQGSDYLNGGTGNDTYIFNQGDGAEVIYDRPWIYGPGEGDITPEINMLVLGDGITTDMLASYVDQYGNTILDLGGGDSVDIGRYSSDPLADQSAIQRIRFADGEVFTVNDVLNASVLQQQLANQVTRQDAQFNFTVPQNPFFMPGAATYTYSAMLANGSALPSWMSFDPVTGTFSGTASNWDVRSLDVAVTATDANGISVNSSFRLDVLNVNDAPTVEMSLQNTSVEVGQQFSYSLPRSTPSESILSDVSDTGTPDQVWIGYDSELYGSGGDDTYNFARGNGNVLISEWDDTPMDTVQFADVLASEVTVSQDQWGTVTLSVNGTTDSLTLSDWLYSDASKVEQLVFADGTVWGVNDIQSRLSTVPTTGNDYITGTIGDDTVLAGAGNDRLEGGGGSDILAGGSGADAIVADSSYSDTVNDLLDGGAGDDYLDASVSNDVIIGGRGNDEIYGDDGNDVLLFNRGDGSDWYWVDWSSNSVAVAQRTDTVSLGGGIAYSELSFSRDWSDLILNVGNGETITFGGWFDTWGQDNKAISTLQIVAEAMAGFDPNSPAPLLNKRIQQFDFVALANQFEAALAADPSITTWDLAPHLAGCHLGGSDTAAIGGDMAYLYGKNGNLDGLSEAEVRAQLNDASLGAANQTLTKIHPAPAVFSDVDFIHGDSLSYSARLADGSPLPSWLTFDVATQTFSGTPGNSDGGVFNISVIATDAGGLSATADFVISVTGGQINIAPVANADAVGTTEDSTQASIAIADLISNDTDANSGDVLSLTGFDVVTASGNTVVQDANGNLVLQLANDYQSLGAGKTATDSFTYTVTDTAGATSTATVNVTITGSNDGPVVATAIVGQSADEDAAFTYTIPAGTFTDVDQGDVLTCTATLADGGALPGWLVFDAATQTFSGTPGNWDVGSLGIVVTATDTGGLSASSSFALNVANVNDAPVVSMAIADQTTLEDAAFSFTVPADTFSDVDFIHGDSLNYSVSLADGGALPSWLRFDAATLTFSGVPTNWDVGTLNVRVTATDQSGASVATTFALDVANVNDAPSAADDSVSTSADTTAQIAIGGLLSNDSDIDAGDTLTLSGFDAVTANGNTVTQDAGGNLVLEIGNRYQYLGAGQTATDSFTYMVTDTAGAASTATVNVTITGTNDAPVVVADIASVQEDVAGAATGNVLANDSDIDQGTVLGVANAGVYQGTYGTLTLNADGSYTYALDNASLGVQSLAEGQVVSEIFDYLATDGVAVTRSTLTVSITGTNDAPVVAADVASIQEDLAIAAIGNVLSNDSDVDQGALLTVANAGVFVGQYGTLTLNADGSYSYVLDNASLGVQALAQGQVVTDSFDYLATDGIVITPSTLTVSITGTNDAPVVAADSNAVQEDLAIAATGNVLSNDSDVDQGSVLSVANAGTSVGQFGTLTLNADGSYSYALDNASPGVQSLAQGQVVSEIFDYLATDGIAVTPSTLTLSITGINDAPVVVADIASIQEDVAIAATGNVLSNDSDVDRGALLTLANAGVFVGQYGTLTLNADGSYSYALDNASLGVQSLAQGQVVTDSFDYLATDGIVVTPSTLTVSITGTNDAPAVAADSNAVQEDLVIIATGNVLANDSDVDQGSLLSVVNAGTYVGRFGTLTLNADGSYSYALDNASPGVQSLAQGQVVTDVFDYQATDGITTTPSTLTVSITGTNDAPVVAVDVAAVQEDLNLVTTGNVLANDSDVDQGTVLSVANAGVFVGVYGALTLNSDGSYAYVLDDASLGVQSLAQGQVVTEVFDYQATDGIATTPSTLTVSITGTNDAPVVVADVAAAQEDLTVTATGNVLANDSDLDQGTVLSVANAGIYQGIYGALSLNADGSYTYQLDNASPGVQSLAQGQVVSETFDYLATDGIATTPSALTVSIMGSNDAPVVQVDTATLREDLDITASGNVLANDSDVDQGTVLSVVEAGTRQGVYGSLTLNADGSYSYQLDNASGAVQSLGRNAQVVEHFGYTATDGITGTAGSLDILIHGSNDAPVLADALDDREVNFNKAFTWQVPGDTFTDIDAGDTLSYSATQADGTALPTWLTFDAATRTFSGQAPRRTGFVDVMVTATDVAADGSTQGSLAASDVFRITVEHGNEGIGNGEDAPPPGHHCNQNDGHGTSPGHPGSQHGSEHHTDAHDHDRHEERGHDRDESHADDKKHDDIDDIIHGWFDKGSKANHHDELAELGLSDHRIDHQANRNVACGASGDYSKQWAQMNAGLKQHLARSGNDDHFDAVASHGAPILHGMGGSQGVSQLGKAEGVQMKAFAGLDEGLERLRG